MKSMIVRYQAINQAGRVVSNTVVVDSPSEAYTELTKLGLTPVNINVDDAAGSATRIKSTIAKWLDNSKQGDTKRASKKHMSFFTAQMSIMLETGTTVAASLRALETQVKCPHWQELIQELGRHVEEGGSFASAVGMYPEVFDPVYANMISAGEASGNLGEILKRLSDLSRQAGRIRNKVISAMIYPAMLTTIAFNVICVLIFFVLPRFEALFEEMGVDLPASTRFFLVLSRVVRTNAIVVALGFAIIITAIVYWLRSKPGRKFIDRVKLKLPVVGSLVSSIIIARVFRLMGLLINSNVTLVESLELTTASTNHFQYADLLDSMRSNVLVGKTMYEIMASTKLMPSSVAEMIRTAEENGQIGKVMVMLADYLDDENETRVATLTSILEPVILVFMGIVIGTVVMSLVLPMFDLSQIAG